MDELPQGRLRQGWGYKKSFDLSVPIEQRDYSGGNAPNFGIYDGVKQGDIFLVPRIPNWGEVALVEATEDFNTGYTFGMVKKYSGKDFTWLSPDGDFGHTFPAKFLKSFVRDNSLVSGDLRKTLKFPRRFKHIYYDGHATDIEKIINAREDDLKQAQNTEGRLETSITHIFNENFNSTSFSEKIYDELNRQFNASEWKFALVSGLKKLFPYYNVDRVGGISEVEHGTDVLITLPGILDYNYAIAIQVKDYDWIVRPEVVDQIDKAEYWNTRDNIELIDKILVVIRAKKSDNVVLQNKAKEKRIRVIFANELKDLLYKIAISHLGIDSEYIE